MKTMKSFLLSTTAIVVATMVSVSSAAMADDVKMPKNVSWTAFGTTSSGYAQSIGIGQMLSNKYGVDLRIIPGENDVGRMIPLKTGQSNICACGIASYFTQEGVKMFASKKWGPQRLYTLFNNVGENGQTPAVAADAGVKAVSDLKGKRLTWLKASPANNTNMTAVLAFGGLTWNDVVKVVVPGWRQSMDAVLNGQADAAWASTLSGTLNRISASPRGLYFPPLPHADKKAWARAQEIAPWFAPSKVTKYIKSAKVSGPYEGMNYPYPLFVAVGGIPKELGYGITKAVMENFEAIKDAGPSMSGYHLDKQLLSYIFPYHPTAIKYYKEKGVWTEANQKATDRLLKRQDVLAAAWKTMSAMNVSDEKYADEWMMVRAAALTAAGLPVVFK
jgi:TRAP transporter TAXI family solute receptor